MGLRKFLFSRHCKILFPADNSMGRLKYLHCSVPTGLDSRGRRCCAQLEVNGVRDPRKEKRESLCVACVVYENMGPFPSCRSLAHPVGI